MPTAEEIVLDTHVLLWWRADTTRLSKRAARAIAEAATITVSAITFWEVGMLLEKQRIALDRPLARWTEDLLADPRIRSADLTPSRAIAAARLKAGHGDPADRIILATTMDLGAALVTKDVAVRRAARQHALTTIW